MAYTPAEKAPAKEKDIDQIVRYLTSTFNNATSKLERPFRSTKTGVSNAAYQYQTEFAFRINEVIQGSRGVLQRNITECNAYIDFVISALNKTDK